MCRKAEWHHHLVAAVDTGLTAALARRLIWFILPPA
jgi:branched-subunit amino acid transport protein